MVNIIGTATELGYINVPDGTIIDIEQLKNYPDEKTVIITTGSQGESMAALSRMASSIHEKFQLIQRIRLFLALLQFQAMKRQWIK